MIPYAEDHLPRAALECDRQIMHTHKTGRQHACTHSKTQAAVECQKHHHTHTATHGTRTQTNMDTRTETDRDTYAHTQSTHWRHKPPFQGTPGGLFASIIFAAASRPEHFANVEGERRALPEYLVEVVVVWCLCVVDGPVSHVLQLLPQQLVGGQDNVLQVLEFLMGTFERQRENKQRGLSDWQSRVRSRRGFLATECKMSGGNRGKYSTGPRDGVNFSNSKQLKLPSRAKAFEL